MSAVPLTRISDSVEKMILGGITKAKHSRESITYNTLIPMEQANMSGTSLPDILTFRIPNNGFIQVSESYFEYVLGFGINVSNTEGDRIVYIQDFQLCSERTTPDSGGSYAKQVHGYMPLSARSIISDSQITKQNTEGVMFDVHDKLVFRQNVYFRQLSQQYINNNSNMYFGNDNKHIVGRILAGTPLKANIYKFYMRVCMPITEMHTLFAVVPTFPMALLNDGFTVKLTLQNPWAAGVNSNVPVEFSDFRVKLSMVQLDPVMVSALKSEKIPYTYQMVDIQEQQMTTNQSFIFNIQQRYQSLDVIQLQLINDKTMGYTQGFSTLNDPENGTGLNPFTISESDKISTPSFYGLQLTHNNTNIFTSTFTSLNGLYRLNQEDCSLSQRMDVQNSTFQPDTFIHYINQAVIKVDDYLNQEQVAGSASFTGLNVSSMSGTSIAFKLMNYDPVNKFPVQSLYDAHLYVQLSFYYSALINIEGGNITLK